MPRPSSTYRAARRSAARAARVPFCPIRFDSFQLLPQGPEAQAKRLALYQNLLRRGRLIYTPNNKYIPHQSKRECARRITQQRNK
jgi:hypothetical protein